jgi:hypothetical protein
VINVKDMKIDPVELAATDWRKSTHSGPNCDNCVEVTFVGETI